MRVDTSNDNEMVKLNVTVPEGLLEAVDELVEDREYTSRSAFVREVLRDTTEPTLTLGAQKRISKRYADVAAGRTMSTDAARERLGIDRS